MESIVCHEIEMELAVYSSCMVCTSILVEVEVEKEKERETINLNKQENNLSCYFSNLLYAYLCPGIVEY